MFFFVTMPLWLGLILFPILSYFNARRERERQQRERQRQQQRDDRIITRKAAPFFVPGAVVRRKADPIHSGKIERVDVTRGLVNVRWFGGTLESMIPKLDLEAAPSFDEGPRGYWLGKPTP